MGWGRMLFLGNWGQQMDIEDQRREIETLREQMLHAGAGNRDTTDLKSRVLQLERENDELRLYMASLVRYLGHKGVLQPEEFRSLVEAVDTEDGRADGRHKGGIVQ